MSLQGLKIVGTYIFAHSSSLEHHPLGIKSCGKFLSGIRIVRGSYSFIPFLRPPFRRDSAMLIYNAALANQLSSVLIACSKILRKLQIKFNGQAPCKVLYLLITLDWTVLNGFELLINCCSICHIFMPTLNQGGAATNATPGTDGTAAVESGP